MTEVEVILKQIADLRQSNKVAKAQIKRVSEWVDYCANYAKEFAILMQKLEIASK